MIPIEDLKIEIWPLRNMGGQHVGTSDGIKVTHIPTDTQAVSNLARSQRKNRKIALEMIEFALTHPELTGNNGR